MNGAVNLPVNSAGPGLGLCSHPSEKASKLKGKSCALASG